MLWREVIHLWLVFRVKEAVLDIACRNINVIALGYYHLAQKNLYEEKEDDP